MECMIQIIYLERTQKPLECESCLFRNTEVCENEGMLSDLPSLQPSGAV